MFNVLRYAGLTKAEIQTMDTAHRQTFASLHPVAAATHFHDMIMIIIKYAFCYDMATQQSTGMGVFGIVLGFGLKFEEQHRAALHSHMLLHIAGLPATAVDMLNQWKSGKKEALERYIETCQWQTTCVPESTLRCARCEGDDEAWLQQIPFSDEITKMKGPGSRTMPEPKTVACTKCESHVAPSEHVAEWIAKTLNVSPEEARQGFVDNTVLEEPLFLDATATSAPIKLDGGPKEGVMMSEKKLAFLGARALRFQHHSWWHTPSCFKAKRTPYCRSGNCVVEYEINVSFVSLFNTRVHAIHMWSVCVVRNCSWSTCILKIASITQPTRSWNLCAELK